MSDELKAAAERLRRLAANEPWANVYGSAVPPYYQHQSADEQRLIAAWLALHDETPIDEAWLKSVGFEWREKSLAFFIRHHRLWMFVRVSGQWWLDFEGTYCGKVGTYSTLLTRGQVRKALDVFGIELAEDGR